MTALAWGAKPQLEKPVGRAVSSPCLTRIYTAPDTGLTVVVVRGEIDYASEDALQKSLTHALSCSARGIEIDLSKVSFWAFSSVKVLLALRQLALRHGKTVSLGAISPIVRRVLDLTDTLCLFTTSTAPATPTPPAGSRPPAGSLKGDGVA
ncbi:STAS domain-containing protein [Streptomyces sp. NPDC048639]|uniref:STAS domain-containing protein n=1 Tax=Streptomyces sp. NPDC048639 TaxID=3365581 RepID=UPI0037203974